jgi:hypothetical protein
MKRFIAALAVALLLGLTWNPARASAPVPTVLGRGPEVHLFPSFGPVGTHVTVVGLGYPPGARVRIVYGPPNAEYSSQPLARATVGARGRFYTGFTVTRPLLLGQKMQPLILGGFEDGTGPSSAAATTAFIVTFA